MLCSSAQRLAGGLLACTWACISCASSSPGPAQGPGPSLDPQPSPSQGPRDQRFALPPIALDGGELPEASSPVAHEEHTHEQMLRVATIGGRDVLDCRDGAEDPELTGELVLSLEISAQGRVLGGSTSPAAGEEGIAAVADCLLERARGWAFPARTIPGHTIVIVPYRM